MAGLLRAEQAVPGCAPPAGGKWRRRRPRWLVVEKVFLNMEWRAGQASFVDVGAGVRVEPGPAGLELVARALC